MDNRRFKIDANFIFMADYVILLEVLFSERRTFALILGAKSLNNHVGVVRMLDQYTVGDIIEGKVTGIKPFGAFVAIDDEHQGLVHISEISHSFVKDINDILSVGDTVKVKILKVEEDSKKISLSIRQTEETPERRPAPKRPTVSKQQSDNKPGFNTLEQKLKDWLKESNEKQAQLNKRLKK